MIIIPGSHGTRRVIKPGRDLTVAWAMALGGAAVAMIGYPWIGIAIAVIGVLAFLDTLRWIFRGWRHP